MSEQSQKKPVTPVTLATLRAMKQNGEKFTCLTAYDATFAQVLEAAGIEVLLVGDSLGMVIQGQESTLPVSMDHMVYHTQAVKRGSQTALLMTDMPFLSYTSTEQALENAGRIMQEGHAHMVKLEGDARILDSIVALSRYGIPVCAHIGLLPQSVYKLGGYRVQGRDQAAAAQLLEHAQRLQDAGADILLMECVPASLGQQITECLEIPTIGIGAGPHCDGQVLVLQDILGLTQGLRPRFAKNFLQGCDSVQAAVENYIRQVKSGEYPAPEHCFK
ncbi:MAG: 3-methyl-2-oxobutanoate hydroxymethyltransferase [Gammaproteobacteria bacterium]|nr:3-methyl-2-oxobutanoate hydroxymethyltransferase [Gammaproteobacteria bacterium]MDH5801084.1 3-methyl-2-oxobutanoate hydroxymethyltransferase [Gammaproteobacteria bacterium]